MEPTTAQLKQVLEAAEALLGARQHDMLTLEEWVALARAVAACTDCKTADLLTAPDFDQVVQYQEPWNEATDGPLPAGAGEDRAVRDVTYEIDAGHLVRRVVPTKGRPYVQRCAVAVYEAVAHAADENAEAGVTVDELYKALGLPHTQIAVAMDFLKERGCVEVRFKRAFPAGVDAYLDAMTEWHALREGSPGSAGLRPA
jgi:hypothetical protein